MLKQFKMCNRDMLLKQQKATKKVRQPISPPPSICFIRDGKKIRIRDKHLGSATLYFYDGGGGRIPVKHVVQIGNKTQKIH
jgi:hypothetical protein